MLLLVAKFIIIILFGVHLTAKWGILDRFIRKHLHLNLHIYLIKITQIIGILNLWFEGWINLSPKQ